MTLHFLFNRFSYGPTKTLGPGAIAPLVLLNLTLVQREKRRGERVVMDEPGIYWEYSYFTNIIHISQYLIKFIVLIIQEISKACA